MTQVLVTGAGGFIGRNLCARLSMMEGVALSRVDVEETEDQWQAALKQADIIFHLAGINRPKTTDEFSTGNAGLTEWICGQLRQLHRTPKIVMSSSIQAVLDNPYGQSKKAAEEALEKFAAETGAPVSIYRLKNVFGKWCRPNYNSVTATFCHNIAHGLPLTISDPAYTLELVYVDDVVEAFLRELAEPTSAPASCHVPDTLPSTRITLGELAEKIQSFPRLESANYVPDFADRFTQALLATYISYVDLPRQNYQLDIKADARGSLAEFVKSERFGQIFVSRTHPGITRGNHYHHTKIEKFLVLEGEALIRVRPIFDEEVTEYTVRGEDYRVVNIPPGHTHSITNTGAGELVTLFWANEIFTPERPDTYFVPVETP